MATMPPRGAHRRNARWEAIAKKIREAGPGENLLIAEDTQNLRSMLTAINQGHTVALRALPGVVVAMMRNGRTGADGRLRGDLWVRWEPDGDRESRYQERYLERDRRQAAERN